MASAISSKEMAEKTTDRPEDAEFVQLIADHQNVIRNFIISLLPGAPGVDDVFQNTNSVIWQKRDQFELGTNFRAWALSIARFQSMAHLQRLRRRRWVSLDQDVAELIADDLESRATKERFDTKLNALDLCLQKMRPKDRELVIQRYWHRTRLQDFAVISGRSVDALKVTLFRLRAALKKCIENQLKENPASS